MATKSKRRPKRRPIASLFQQAQRNLARGHAKQALKEAKVCFRQEPTEAHRRLFEQASLARAQELHRFGMRAECRSVLETLLEVGVTESSVERELPGLLVAVGLFDRSPTGKPLPELKADPALLASAADHAVLRPKEAPASLPEVRPGALAIRAALEAVYAGKESEAIRRLKNIARNSPFADWKYFVRGLAAYYRRDTADMQANWDRLDPDRLAARIVGPLRTLADPALSGQRDRQAEAAAARIATAVLGGPVLALLHDLRTHVAAGRLSNALASLRKSQNTLRRFDPHLPGRIALTLCPEIVRKGLTRQLAELTSIVDPPPTDPHWNQAWALSWEHPDNYDHEEAEKCWLNYLEDLAELPCLLPADRTLAQALVWERVARLYVRESTAIPQWVRRRDDILEEFQERAVECFEHSLRLAPNLLSAHEALGAAQLHWDQSDQACETNRRLLEHFPDHLDALLFLAKAHATRDEPFEAREYAIRARRLKPTNREITLLLWGAHVGAARHYALQGEWEKGRAEFEAADRVNSELRDAYYLSARKAIFEIKAGNFERGEQFVLEAQSQAGEPAPALLVLAIEASRYDLSKTPRDSFLRQWKAALKKRCRSQTAGQMAETMAAHLATDLEYRGRSAHLKHLAAYLRRCSRVKWQESDLRQVCAFLEAVSRRDEFDDQSVLLQKLVRKGLRKFPRCPTFHFLTGQLEMEKGPRYCNRPYAEMCFQRALEHAKSSGKPEDAEIADRAKQILAFLEEAAPAPPFGDFSFDDDEEDDDGPFGGPPPYGFSDEEEGPCFDAPPRSLFAMFARACEEMGLDPEEVLNEAAEGMPRGLPRPKRPSGAKRKRRRKKKR